jgi:SAM-dependent methyltransferase
MWSKVKALFVAYADKMRRIIYRYKPVKWKFTEIYRHSGFGGTESVSGPGSSLEETEAIRQKLPGLFNQFNIKSILDAPCGDFNWFQKMDLDLENYTGADIVQEMISELQANFNDTKRRFITLDILKDDLPKADLILCRDCFIHLSFKHISRAIKNFKRSGAKYLLTTTFTDQQKNKDIPTGVFHPINLQAPPFNFPEPIAVINEKCSHDDGKFKDKSLALWEFEDL